MIATSRAESVTATTRLGKWRASYVFVCVAIATSGIALGRHGHPLAGVATAAFTVAAIAFGVGRLHPTRARAWTILGFAVVVLAIGEMYAGMSHTFGVGFPAPTDFVTALDYVPLAIAVLWIGHPPKPRQHMATALDAAVISLAVTLLAWVVLVRPTIAKLHLSTAGRDVIVIDWATYVATGAVAALLILTWRANRAALLLAAAMIALLVSDVLQADALLHGTARAATIDIGFVVFCGLAGLAALDPAMTHITAVGSNVEQLGIWRLVVLAGALLVPPAVLLAEAVSGPIHGGAAIALVAGAIGLVMLARVAVALRALRERGVRERAVSDAAGRLGSATSGDEVTSIVNDAVRSMLPASTTAARLHPPDAALIQPTEIREGVGGVGYLRCPISVVQSELAGTEHAVGEVRFSGPAPRLFALKPALVALADQGGTTLARIGLTRAVRQHEQETYFRTLVQNSSDVIIISRDGTVDYATPAATGLFAEDAVVGRRIGDLFFVSDAALDTHRAAETTVAGPDGLRRVEVRRQDLTNDPTVHGLVWTLHDVTEQRQLHDELTHQATHDVLTGLPNRQMVRTELQNIANVAGRGNVSAALFIDLDNLKDVNDTHGHGAGDDLLKVAADRIRACTRRNDLAARVGGDEFAVLLRNAHTSDVARDIAARLVNAFRRPALIRTGLVDCTASVGLATAATSDEYGRLLHRADIAVYAAKADGKNTWREFRTDLTYASDAEIDVHAVDDRVRLRYQPIVDMTTGCTVGFEARARRPGTSPADLVADAERRGLTAAMGERVVETALADLTTLDGAGERFVSVNLSAAILRDGTFAHQILDRLDAMGVPPRRLMVELIGDRFLDGESTAWESLAMLHDQGVRIAVDDFDAASSSLDYLRQRAIDVVKLDTYLKDRDDPRIPLLLDAIVQVTRRLGIEVIADEVDNEVARDHAMANGFRFAQGKTFAAPMTAPDAAAYARSSDLAAASRG